MAARLQVMLVEKRELSTPGVIRRLAHATEVTDQDLTELREALAIR
jgi:hypothetical protein